MLLMAFLKFDYTRTVRMCTVLVSEYPFAEFLLMCYFEADENSKMKNDSQQNHGFQFSCNTFLTFLVYRTAASLVCIYS